MRNNRLNTLDNGLTIVFVSPLNNNKDNDNVSFYYPSPTVSVFIQTLFLSISSFVELPSLSSTIVYPLPVRNEDQRHIYHI